MQKGTWFIEKLIQPDLDFDFDVKMEIEGERVVLELRSKKTISDVVSMRNVAEDFAFRMIDAWQIPLGEAFELSLFTVELPDGSTKSLRWGVPKLLSIFGHEGVSDININNLLKDLDAQQDLMLVMENCRLAIRHASLTPHFCMKALDVIRHYFQKKSNPPIDFSNRKKGWDELHTRLKNDVETQKYFRELDTGLGQQVRHGESPFLPGSKRVEMLEQTWHQLARFIKYLVDLDNKKVK